jgi:hypothetical protein
VREAWIERARAVPIVDELTRRGHKLKRVGGEYIGPCPKCGGTGRFSVNPNKAVWNCRGCSIGGDVIDLVHHLDGGAFDDNVTTLAGPNNVAMLTKKTNGKTSGNGNGGHHAPLATEHPYRDETGALVHVVVRTKIDGRKAIKQKRPDPNNPKHWISNSQGCRVIPYKLPELIEAMPLALRGLSSALPNESAASFCRTCHPKAISLIGPTPTARVRNWTS